MKITVKNFGPIREAKDICISPLTMFVGPSNTGKTYLAMASRAAIEAASVRYFVAAVSANKLKVNDIWVRKYFDKWLRSAQDMWKKRIVYYLGEEGENILKSRNVSVTISSDDGSIVIDLCQPKKSRIRPTRFKSLVANAKKTSPYLSDATRPSTHPELGGWVSLSLTDEVSSLLCGNLRQRIYCLPAVRGGIMTSYRLIADQSIRSAAEFDAESGNVSPMFSGVFSDCARQLIGISKNGRGGKEIIAINKILESDILHGRINVIFPDIGLPEFRYVMKGKKSDMAINNVSASVAELAPLSVFMRYYLKQNDFLIFEEPETNLHPQGQRDIADVMVRLANAGVFVLATTHSDIVLEQISNAVHAADIKEKKPKAKIKLLGKNGQNGALLERKDVVAYSFVKQVQGGTEVRKLPFVGAAGFVPKEHIKISEALYDETVELYSQKNS